jgi:quercetin dioxygenase-like cupin family protein
VIKTFPLVQVDAKSQRQVLSDSPELMMVAFTFAEGGEGKLHSHPHIQSTYIQSGRFVFSLDGVETEVGPGDSFVVPSNVVHGCRCLEGGKMIDSFTPRRDDFL